MNAAGSADRPAATFRYVAGTALAAALLTGCAGSGNADRFSSIGTTTERASLRDADRSVALAEKSVALQPDEAGLRVNLAQAYMKVGRFESAITAFDDAMELGDENPRTALSLALANIAIGRSDEAGVVLDDWRADLAPADLGLAYALAGQARHGAAIVADAVRAGENTSQTRQNLAYALALDGRWREARIMMSQDLAADEVNRRLGEWASLASTGNPRVRVAAMLGAPMRTDSGQPARLALAVPAPARPADGRAESSLAAPQRAATDVPVAHVALGDAETVGEPVATRPFEAAFARPGFVAVPVVQNITASPVRQPAAVPARARIATTARAPAPTQANVPGGTHLVQLGSFTSEQGARRAWGVYTAQHTPLRSYRMTVIPVTVDGKNYWRLAAAGFDAGTASTMCGTIKARGGTCLTYASNQMPRPGSRGRPQLARSR